MLLSGCSAFGSDQEDAYPVQATARGITPGFMVEVRGEALVVEYTLENSGQEPVTVVDQLPAVIGMSDMTQDDVDPRLAYVGAAGDRTMRISRQVFGLGDDSGNPDVQPVVGGTRLEPGQEHEGVMEVPLPVQAKAPGYSTPNFSDGGLGRSEQVQACLGIVGDLPGEGEFRRVPVSQQDQVLVCSAPEALPEGVTFA
ncbi:hypothetical protein GCM10022261_19290 [Brevibacterium daeguense]|uniref:Uncharacterized protein n=1 Tax=Brevibacterium daeguense TaxID=909936 RepID=A0ABP8EKB9_9MICO